MCKFRLPLTSAAITLRRQPDTPGHLQMNIVTPLKAVDAVSTVPLDTFLAGTVVNLRHPDLQRDVMEGAWHSWFNDPDITAFLTHGVRPITREQERDIIASDLTNPRTLMLSVVEKATGQHLGVVCLNNIDHLNRMAEIRIVLGGYRPKGAALEAMALITKHAFDRLNLQMLYAGQHEGLWRWVNTIGLIGYRIDGFREFAGWRNGKPYSIILTSVTSERFYALQEQRGGAIMTNDIPALLATRHDRDMVQEFRDATAHCRI